MIPEPKYDGIVFRHIRTTSKKNLGGITVAFDKKTQQYGIAVCSKKDSYNKAKGRIISFHRIKEDAKMDILDSQVEILAERYNLKIAKENLKCAYIFQEVIAKMK